jgi:BMFP domain-containing protein YqiC
LFAVDVRSGKRSDFLKQLGRLQAQRQQGSISGAVPGQQQQPAGGNYEMAGLREPDRVTQPTGPTDSFQDEVRALISFFFFFFEYVELTCGTENAQVQEVENMLADFNAGVQRISQLHGQSLNNMDPAANEGHQAALDGQVEATRQLSNQLKQRINALEARPAVGQEARMQKNIVSIPPCLVQPRSCTMGSC